MFCVVGTHGTFQGFAKVGMVFVYLDLKPRFLKNKMALGTMFLLTLNSSSRPISRIDFICLSSFTSMISTVPIFPFYRMSHKKVSKLRSYYWSVCQLIPLLAPKFGWFFVGHPVVYLNIFFFKSRKTYITLMSSPKIYEEVIILIKAFPQWWQ